MNRNLNFTAVALIATLSVAAAVPAAEQPLRLEALAPEVEQFGLIEFAIELPSADADASDSHRTDSHRTDLCLVISTPSGQVRRLPAFPMQPYEQKTVSRSGRPAFWMYPVGPPIWTARFAPAEVGRYRAVAELRNRNGAMKSTAVEFHSTAAGSPGFVRISSRDPRYFEFDNGQPFFPIGQNLAFIGEGQYVTMPKMERIFHRMSENGANWVRIWTCCDDWALAIEARKSAWGRSWNWRPPIVPLPGKEASGRKCVQLTDGRGSNLSVSTSHPVALRPGTDYVLSGRIRTQPQTRVQVISGRHQLDHAVTSGSAGQWQTFRLKFATGNDEYWLPRTALQREGDGTAWLDGLSLTEADGGPELLWEADVNRKVRGFYNPVDCFMLDRIVATAQRRGIYLQLCLLTRNLYMDSLTDEQSQEYQQAIDDAKNLLRYAVARWGYATAVVSWEYFNEQDPNLPTDRFYREMGEYLARIDTYGHLRSTSTWHPSPRDWRHPQLDVADTHFYLRPAPDRKYPDEVAAAVGNAAQLRRYATSKPALIGEFGLANTEWQPTKAMKESQELIDFHNGIWASALSGASGTAMFWWWERLDSRNHYPDYRPLADFVADIPWTTAGLQPAAASVLDSAIRVHGLAGQDQAYLWLFDPQASFENVVLGDVDPQEVEGVEIQLRGLAPGDYRVQWWHTRLGKVIREQSVTVSKEPLRLVSPPFTRDVAVKIRRLLDAEPEKSRP